MSTLDLVLADLAAEGDQLESVLTGLREEQWRTPTPAPHWDVATQIAHLAWTDEVATFAASDQPAWDALVARALEDIEHFVDHEAEAGASAAPATLLARWRAGRSALAAALREVPDGQKLPWFGPPMSPTSMATARFMETWAHALDVYDALGVEPVVSDRIKHVAHIGVRTRGFAFATRGLEVPTGEVRVELVAPSGEPWTWGPEDAPQRVSGPAYDFCRLVTQRLHRDDTDLVAVGEDAETWLGIAQAFAGPPGAGREPSSE